MIKGADMRIVKGLVYPPPLWYFSCSVWSGHFSKKQHLEAFY